MKISANFDSGNIEVKDISDYRAQLGIRKDSNADYKQWFHFRVSEVLDQHCYFTIADAAEAFVPEGWENYRVCASYDRQEWFRLPTEYKDGKLSWELLSEMDSVYFAYFAPYSYERHLDLVQQAQGSPLCLASVIGQTVQQRDIDMLTIGVPSPEKKKIWVIARQHPGESMAEWFIEGLLQKLLDSDEAVSRKLMEQCCFYVIPNMNIDGSVLGNLRANAAGANLNREWQEPSKEKSPEVYYTLKAMEENGIDLLLDVHGDEEIAYNFITTSEGVPGYSDELHQFEEEFKKTWMEISPDFQDEHNYGKDEPGKANLTVCSNAINHRFKVPAFTLEMPFKDNDDLPDARYGWSPERCVNFAGTVPLILLRLLNKF